MERIKSNVDLRFHIYNGEVKFPFVVSEYKNATLLAAFLKSSRFAPEPMKGRNARQFQVQKYFRDNEFPNGLTWG